MVAAAKAAVPTVGDQAAALQLGNFAKATATALAELRAASTKVCLLLNRFHKPVLTTLSRQCTKLQSVLDLF